MSKVLTFSRTFPAHHPKAGQPTFFVEKILQSLSKDRIFHTPDDLKTNPQATMKVFQPKHHTIRAGNRFKIGDKFSPRVWSGKPYCSPQIIIAPDITVEKVWKFEIRGGTVLIDDVEINADKINRIALNDGLDIDDFWKWFKYPQPFTGQIICWNLSINY